jgi:hypothetical protein
MIDLTAGSDFEIIQLPALANGLYIINIKSGNITENKKLLIIN